MKYNTSSESSFQPANCESESERSLRSDSGYVTEKAQQKPDFILKPHTVEVKAGGTAVFLCRITGSPTPSIKWETNGKTINNDERHKVQCILFFFGNILFLLIIHTSQFYNALKSLKFLGIFIILSNFCILVCNTECCSHIFVSL